MILTLTPNPAFDRIQTVPGFARGQVCRAVSLKMSAGGKGINVARAIHQLGGTACCTGILGGHTGRLLAELARQDGLAATWTWVEGETRVSPVILSPDTGETTVINEAGPTVTAGDGERLLADVLSAAGRSSLACLCGSLPPGLPHAFAADVVNALRKIDVPLCVDSSGETLRQAMTACPAMVKINQSEAAALLGWNEPESPEFALKAAQEIRSTGIPRVVLTLGKDGAILVNKSGAWHAISPPMKPVCTIGSGDSFLAGLVLHLQNGMPDEQALRCAVASGSANTLSAGGGSFPRQSYESILSTTTLARIA